MQPEPPCTSADTGRRLKIIIPVWDDKVSPLLDTAGRLLLVEAQNRAVTSRCEVLMDEADLARRCFRIWRLKADVLICGAVSRAFARLLAAEPGLTIIQGISGPAREVLQAFLRGTLNRPRFMMPGSRRWQSRSGGLP